jgi:hypothetical protein
MRDELDPDLRRMFASTAESPADEVFVEAVTARTSRERRISFVAAGLGGAAALGALAAVLGVALQQSARMIAPLVTSPPLGLAAGLGLAVAGLICFRLLSPLRI